MITPEITQETVAALVRIGIVFVVAVIGTWVAGRLIGRVTRLIVDRTSSGSRSDAAEARRDTRSQTITAVLRAILGVVVWTLAVLLILGELGFDLAPLIAGAGIVGLAVGFGAQGLVSDVVSGLFMLMEDQYGVGDWIDAGEAAGTVERMGLRTTRIRDLDGLLWTVRNGEIARTANANQGWGRAVVDVPVAYGSDLRRCQQIIKRVADDTRSDPDHGAKFLAEPEIWGIQELGDDGITVRLACTTQPATQWGLARELRLRISEALAAEGIEIPFPQRTVWLRTEPETLAEPLPIRVDGRT